MKEKPRPRCLRSSTRRWRLYKSIEKGAEPNKSYKALSLYLYCVRKELKSICGKLEKLKPT